MDLADIRKKAKKSKESGPVSDAPGEKPAPSIQGAPAEAWGVPEPVKVLACAAQVPVTSHQKAIDRLFEEPFRIEQVDEKNLGFAKQEQEDNDIYRQWLTFSLCGEEYAIDIESVNEIIKPRDVTDIPRVPEFILGIISLRGIIVPVYDLARRLGLGQVAIGSQTRVIVCHFAEKMVGLLVENITQVVRMKEKKIEPPPAVLSGVDRDFVAGVGRYQGRMLILLQLEHVLNPELV